MITLRKASQRGRFDFGWLDTNHTFSFGEYADPAHMGFRSLRVINEDTVAPAKGFGAHGHRDMEILSYVLSGELSHKDNQGNTGVIRPGDVQRMSAGTGIMHSEFNASAESPVHFLQIWIIPSEKGVSPRYEDRTFPADKRRNRLCLIASPDEAEGSLSLHQDAKVYASILDAGKEISLEVAEKRGVWVQVARGRLGIGTRAGGPSGTALLGPGDGAAIENEGRLILTADSDAEFLVFDLA